MAMRQKPASTPGALTTTIWPSLSGAQQVGGRQLLLHATYTANYTAGGRRGPLGAGGANAVQGWAHRSG